MVMKEAIATKEDPGQEEQIITDVNPGYRCTMRKRERAMQSSATNVVTGV